jgi:NADPH-dependent curcumin reductase CurA
MAPLNRQVRLQSRPTGVPGPEHFLLAEAPTEEPGPGELLIRNEYLSVEPAMRGWVADLNNYSAPVPIGSVMRSLAAGEVVSSRHPDFQEGDKVIGWFGWQEYATVPAVAVTRKVTENDLPLSLYLGVLGINGVTAYFGLLDVGQPRPGDTVVVSTAAGAVGSVVGQIAKLMGCRTIGITGGVEKVQLCTDLYGFDQALDYKALGEDIASELAEACPNGINVYFDNVAGAITDRVLGHLAIGARVVICGTASIQSWTPVPTGPRVERILLTRRARAQGFVVFDYQHRHEEAIARLADWVRQGRLAFREDVQDGIESCLGAIAGLYRGENLGKRIIRLYSR